MRTNCDFMDKSIIVFFHLWSTLYCLFSPHFNIQRGSLLLELFSNVVNKYVSGFRYILVVISSEL